MALSSRHHAASSRTGSAPLDNRFHRLRFEPLEDRRMLSVGGLDDASNQAIEVFHAQDALFAENAGQWDNDSVYFGYNKGGTQIYFTDESIEFGLSQRELKDGVDPAELEMGLPGGEEDLYETTSTHFSLNFDGAAATIPTGADRAETVFNYHVGSEEDWVDGVATYKTVVYDDVYAGIDLHTFSRHGEMKYEFHVAPGADWSEIQLSYEGIEGLSIREDGSLRIETAVGEIVDEGLYIYQTIDGAQVEVAGTIALLDDDTYTFTVTGDYDPSVELVIDPALEWSSYLGSATYDCARAVATDTSGNVYVAGYTESSGWVSAGWDTLYEGVLDGFVVSLNRDGTHRWSSYLGGASGDRAFGLATDTMGNVYVAGHTNSSGWVSGGWYPAFQGYLDGFVVSLAPDGTHRWSSYLGGADSDAAYGVATDASGNVYVAGETDSSGWVSGGWDTSHGSKDGFVVSLTPDGTHRWSSYVGGDYDDDSAWGVATDASGNVYVAGKTYSSWWASGGWDTSYCGSGEGFVVSLDSDGTHRWSSYLGADGRDYARGVATDASGNVYVAGYTDSAHWVSGGWEPPWGWSSGFVVSLAPDGTHRWSSPLGGMDSDIANSVATDASGNVYVAGGTQSSGWVSGGWDTSLDGDRDAFVVSLTRDGTHRWSSYVGGADSDSAWGVATDSSGNVYVAGDTESSGWVFGGWNPSHKGDADGFVVKISGTIPSGDLNADGLVNSADLDIIRANWGAMVPVGSLLNGDPSGDGLVGSADLDIIRANWGAGVSAAAGARHTTQDPARALTPSPYGPRRAPVSDAALAALSDSPTRRHLSDADLAALAEAAWLREIEGLRNREKKTGAEGERLSRMVLVGGVDSA